MPYLKRDENGEVSTSRFHVDCFSSLDDIPRKMRGDPMIVLRALNRAKRFSCFEVEGKLGGALTAIEQRGWATFDTNSVGYPWTKVDVTDAGRAALAMNSTT